MFVEIRAPQREWKGLLAALACVIGLHVAVIWSLFGVKGRPIQAPPEPPKRLSVTLLDAPELGAKRSLGLAGGEGEVVLGSATSVVAEQPAAKGAPTLGSKPKRKVTKAPRTIPVQAEKVKEAQTPDPVATGPETALSPKQMEGKIVPPRTQQGEEQQRSTPSTAQASATSSAVTGGGGIGTAGGTSREGLGSGQGAGLSAGRASGDTTVLSFRDGMKRPKLLSKVDPVFTKQAREAGAQGLILTKCVITTKGHLRDCKIIKGIPLMNKQVLSALRSWRYEPVIYQGSAVSVRYLIPVRLKLR